MEGKVSPGLFHLTIPVNDEAISKGALKRKLMDLGRDLKTRIGQPEELAIRNLMGLINCHLEQYEDGLDTFRIVLSMDNSNLNAMASVRYVLEKVDKAEEAEPFRDKLASYLCQPAEGTDDVSESDTNPRQHARERARCLAEQAYAHACDIHPGRESRDSATRNRYILSNALFKNALRLASDLVETSEEEFWKFCVAKTAHKIFYTFSYDSCHIKDAANYMDEAVDLFLKVAQRDLGDSEYRWKSWRHLADIFCTLKERKHLSYSHLPPKLKTLIKDPEQCMKKAVEVSPNNAMLLASYAELVSSLKGERAKDALKLLDRSISLDDSDINYLAFSTRGLIRLNQCKVEEDSLRYSLADRKMLEMARDDLEKAIAFRDTGWDLLNAGKVYHLFARCCTDESKETRRKYLERALEYFKQTADCEDVGVPVQRSERHARGQCLFDLGKYREAIVCFNETIKLQSPTSQYTEYFQELFCCYLCLLRNEYKQSKDTSILNEMTEALRAALTKHGKSGLWKFCFGSLQSKYKDELKLLTDHCMETIPNDKALLGFLRSHGPPSPKSPAAREGGTLRDIWVDLSQLEDAPDTTADMESSENPSVGIGTPSQTPHVPHRPAATSTGSRPKSGEPSDAEETPLPSASGNSDISDIQASAIPSIISESLTEDQERTEYDFYVVHTESDHEWVHQKLLRELETRNLTGCTSHRDAIAGSFVVRNELQLMASSACTLLILSEDFKNECAFTMHHALQQKSSRRGVIPVRKDGSAVPSEISVLNPFNATAERVDWDKLARRIERVCSGARDRLDHGCSDSGGVASYKT